MPPFRYHRPETIEGALALLAEYGPDAKVLAGGQSLLPLLALRLSRPEHLVDIGGLEQLAFIEVQGDAVVIGATVRHARAEDSPVVTELTPLAAAAVPYIGHRAIRNRGTICGSLAHADPAAELPAVALAAEAELVVRSVAGERSVPSQEFFLGYLTSELRDGELLAAVRFPAWRPGTGWSVQEVSRRHGDYALVGLAALLGAGVDRRIDRAALSFFGVGSTPVRVGTAEQVLVGEEPSEVLFAEAAAIASKVLEPPDDNHASAAYRRHVAGILVRRCLSEAADRMEMAA